MLLRLPKVKFVTVTLGKDGCIMLERSANGWYILTFFFLSFFFVEDGGVKGCLEEGDHMLALVRS